MKPLVRAFGKQVGHPRGQLGRLASRMMRGGNARLNLWMVDLLRIEPTDRVLEVGFGPGVALAALLDRASAGTVTGVDRSELMVRQARIRFDEAIAAGRLELRQGDAQSLPDADERFDKIGAAHVIYFWPDAVAAVRELRRVLRPGGVLALAYQAQAHMPERARAGLSQTGAQLYGPGEVEVVVRSAGFADVRTETLTAPDGPGGFCVVAVK